MAGKSENTLVIGKREVDALTVPADGEAWFWDARLKGFGIRVKANGTKSYVLQYRNAAGQSRKFTIGRHGEITPDQARKRAATLLAEIRLGNDPTAVRQEQRQAVTVAELATRYLAEAPAARPDKKPSSWRTDRSNLNRHVLPLIGSRQARTLVKADIERWQQAVAEGKTAADVKTGFRGRAIVEGGKGAAARAFATLRAMLSWAAERAIIPDNAARGVRPFAGQKRERFLSTDEVARLGEATTALVAESRLNPKVAAVIRLLLLTGCRKSEILTLQWRFVSLDRQSLDLPDSKCGARIVPLSAAALAVLADLPREQGSPWVFPAERGTGHLTLPYKDWQRVAMRADLPEVRLHDLRHSFASAAVAGGASLYLTSKLLGPKQSRTTERYAHFSEDPVRAAANLTADRLADALNGGKSGEVIALRNRTRP